MSAPVETFDAIAAYLTELVARFGAGIFDDRRRLQSFLTDKLPDARREIRTICTLVDERVQQALTGCDRSLIGIEMDRQVERLTDELGMQPQLARNAIRAIGHGLGLGPPPSVYEDAREPAPAPAMPVADAGSWAGLSEAVQPSVYPAQASEPAQGFAGAYQNPDSMKKVKWIAGGVAGAFVLLVGIGMMLPDDKTGPEGQQQGTNYADENADYGVAAKSELEPNVGSPTPLEIPGAVRITTAELVNLRAGGQVTLVDVLANPHPQTIAGAAYEPKGGQPGTFTDAIQGEFSGNLKKLTGGNSGRTLVFFCAGPACWESYNAALRASHAGYSDIKWYRGGLAAWGAAGQPMAPLPAGGTAQLAAGGEAAAPAAAAQASAPDIEQFVRKVYASYGPKGEGLYNLSEYLTDRAVRSVERDPGRFGADPICQCQDWDGISVTSVKVTSDDGSKAVAEVGFKDMTGPAHKTTMRLVKTGKGWRLDDLTDESGRMVLAN